jgi:hypothetical protein
MDLTQYSTLELLELEHIAKRIESERATGAAGSVAVAETGDLRDRDRSISAKVRDMTTTAGQRLSNRLERGLTLDIVEVAFTYQPWDSFQTDAGAQVRDALVAAAKVILRVVPEGPDKSVALRKLREVQMDANSAITHGGRF